LSALYLIGLGSNMRHHRYGSPRAILDAAVLAMEEAGLDVVALSRAVSSKPVGPSQRLYANAAAMVRSALEPENMLTQLQSIERNFGRSRRGQRWRARVLDLDIIMWSGGIWQSGRLSIPHPRFRERDFVLGPASTIAGDWRDPITGLTIRQLTVRQLSVRAPAA
jgi:2-amino-4-hydroxy-6-hydroxymethyldihydropteridine diphosphokinase